MATSAQSVVTTPAWRWHADRRLVLLVLLVPLFVGVCYLLDWHWLRALTTTTLVTISAALGIPMYRIAPDVVEVAGIRAQFVVACTMIDAFCGAIPLLWRNRVSILSNVMRLTAVFSCVMLLNIIRLEAGFAAMNSGAPWWLAHECVSGLTYFCLYLFIAREKAWEK